MKAIDMTDVKINHLTFLEKDKEKGSGYWKCKCDCGNIVTIRKDQVTRIKYPKQDCGCGLKKRISNARLKDEVGNKYGKLTVLYRTEDLKPGVARWHCKCECGNECDVDGYHLRNKTVQSCGCLKHESHNAINEINNRYGKLIVLYRSTKTDGTHIFWHCKCDCGNECDVSGSNLRQGITTSCGCTRSLGENKIKEILEKNNINFIKEYSFPDLIGKRGGKLRFDFGILDKNNQLSYLIEFDGIQHFKDNCFGGKEKTDVLREHDKLKDNYCKDKNITLIRIPYTKLATLNINDLVLEEVTPK